MNDSVFRKPTAVPTAASTIAPPAPRTEWRLGSFSTVLGVGLIVLGLVVGFGLSSRSTGLARVGMVRCEEYGKAYDAPVRSLAKMQAADLLYHECTANVAQHDAKRRTVGNWLAGIPLALGALVLFKAWWRR